MPALNFTLKSKIKKVLSGECFQTIRPLRKYPIKLDDRLYLYVGMRTKKCRKLGEVVCKKIIPIKLKLLDLFSDGTEIYFSICHGNKDLEWPVKWQYALAKDDGFDSWEDFEKFFINTYKMKPGDTKAFVIIKWKNI